LILWIDVKRGHGTTRRGQYVLVRSDFVLAAVFFGPTIHGFILAEAQEAQLSILPNHSLYLALYPTSHSEIAVLLSRFWS
jgi:hypothetical protein